LINIVKKFILHPHSLKEYPPPHPIHFFPFPRAKKLLACSPHL